MLSTDSHKKGGMLMANARLHLDIDGCGFGAALVEAIQQLNENKIASVDIVNESGEVVAVMVPKQNMQLSLAVVVDASTRVLDQDGLDYFEDAGMHSGYPGIQVLDENGRQLGYFVPTKLLGDFEDVIKMVTASLSKYDIPADKLSLIMGRVAILQQAVFGGKPLPEVNASQEYEEIHDP